MPSDYISRSELLKKIDPDGRNLNPIEVRALIVQQSTTPVESVVHCSDCQYRNTVECLSYRKLVDTGEIITPPYVRFCSYGERKDGDNNG